METHSIKYIIDVLRSGDFYGAGKFTEIAKGKNELVTDWEGIKRKIKRKRKA
tara:strand:- start:947 stop:1102 length:156 start_codon:yes stop_codon:yes gene_type:complete